MSSQRCRVNKQKIGDYEELYAKRRNTHRNQAVQRPNKMQTEKYPLYFIVFLNMDVLMIFARLARRSSWSGLLSGWEVRKCKSTDWTAEQCSCS